MSLHPSVSYRRIRLWLLAVELSRHFPQHRRPQLVPCARRWIRVGVDAECRRACFRLARLSCLLPRFLLRSHLPRPRLALGLGPRPELAPDSGGSEIAACCWAPAARAPLPSAPEGAGKGARLPPRPKEGRHEKAPGRGAWWGSTDWTVRARSGSRIRECRRAVLCPRVHRGGKARRDEHGLRACVKRAGFPREACPVLAEVVGPRSALATDVNAAPNPNARAQ